MAQHQGIGGYGYCVECGQKPGNAAFNPKKCLPLDTRLTPKTHYSL